jgi:hypothetical protein
MPKLAETIRLKQAIFNKGSLFYNHCGLDSQKLHFLESLLLSEKPQKNQFVPATQRKSHQCNEEKYQKFRDRTYPFLRILYPIHIQAP